MKQMKMMKRVLLALLCVCLLATAFASCSGSTTLDSKWLATDGDENCRHYFTRILMLDATQAQAAREAFVAAYNGYNMSAEGFDDDKLVSDPAAVEYTDANGNVHNVSMDGAKAAMNKIKPTAAADQTKFTALLDTMTAEDVCKIVEMMRVQTVDLSGNSFPGIILEWIGLFLGVMTNITGGYYVLALFFFALVVEIAMLYFGIKQQKNSVKQARLRPKEMAIRKKYAGRTDQKSLQAMQMELQKFYQEEGASPLSGCLPLLIQMPIVIALYNIVINPLRYVMGKGEGIVNALTKYATTARAAGGLGISVENPSNTIELLSQIKDPAQLEGIKNFAWFTNSGEVAGELSDVMGNLPNFHLFGLDMGATPSFTTTGVGYWLLLIPLLTFVTYFISMKLNRKFMYQPAAQDPQMGCSNNMMDLMMPAMSVYITFITPAAVGVYWIFKCVITTVKQFLLHKAMPLPTFTEEDYKRAEREMKGKLRPEERDLPTRTGPVRSLHRIDDEDDLPARVRGNDEEEEDSIYERRKKEAAAAKQRADEAAEQRRLAGAKLKEDRKNNKKK